MTSRNTATASGGSITIAEVQKELRQVHNEEDGPTLPDLPKPLRLGPQAATPDARIWKPTIDVRLADDEGYKRALGLVSRLGPLGK